MVLKIFHALDLHEQGECRSAWEIFKTMIEAEGEVSKFMIPVALLKKFGS